MKELKALVTAAFSEYGIKSLQEKMEVEYHNWMLQGRPYTQQELIQLSAGKDILVVEVCEVHREVLEANEELKIIACCRGLRGDDPTIDIDACNERNIPILFAHGRNSNSVAEFTILMTLAVMRKIRAATKWMYENQWKNWLDFYTTFRTSELNGKTVGLIGFGNIGRKVAVLFNAFDAKVISFDPFVSDSDIYARHNAQKVDLETLLRNSDIVSLHMNVTSENKGFIDAEKLALMKPTAFLVNSARAALVDHDALYDALRTGKIAGAAIDVFHQEPVTTEQEPLLQLDNVFATPHLAGTANEVIDNHSRIVTEDINRLLRGERPQFILNPEVLPAFFAGSKTGK